MTGVEGGSTWARGATRARPVTAARAAKATARVRSATSGWRRSAARMRPRFIDRSVTSRPPPLHRPPGGDRLPPTAERPGPRGPGDRPGGGPADPAPGRAGRLVRSASSQQAPSKEETVDQPIHGAVRRGEVLTLEQRSGRRRDYRLDEATGTWGGYGSRRAGGRWPRPRPTRPGPWC